MRTPEIKPEDTPHAFAPPHGPAWPLAGSCVVCTRGSGHHIHDVSEVDPEDTPHAFVTRTAYTAGMAYGLCEVCGWAKGSHIHDATEAPEPESASHTFVPDPLEPSVCEPADGNTQDAPYWKAIAEGWHAQYLAALDERDRARAERNKLQARWSWKPAGTGGAS